MTRLDFRTTRELRVERNITAMFRERYQAQALACSMNGLDYETDFDIYMELVDECDESLALLDAEIASRTS